MPKICLEIPEVSDCVSRPIAVDVIRDLCSRIGISKNTSLRYKGSAVALPVPGSTLDDKDALNRLPGDTRITIEVVEDYNEDYALSVAVKRPDNICFFVDADLGIFIKPVYQRVTATVNVIMTATDETSADTWMRTMKRRATQGVAENLHLANYHYPVNVECLAILLELHQLRELQGGYGEDFGTYLKNHFSDKMTVIRDQAGNNPTFVIKEKQQAILGWFDFPTNPPRYDKQDDSGTWSINFTYTYVFDAPNSLVMEYPLMVHNQLLPKWYPDVKPAELEDYVTQPSLSTAILRSFTYETRYAHAWRARPGIPIPYFDDWYPDYEYPDHQNLLRIMLQRDNDNPHAIISLTQLGYVSLPEWILAYMRKNPLSITTNNENVFTVALYRGRQLMDPSKLIFSPELDIHYADPLDIRSAYHFTLSLNKRLMNLSPAAIKTLSENGETAIRLLIAIDPTIITQETITGLNGVTAALIREILIERNERVKPILTTREQEKELTRIASFVRETKLVPNNIYPSNTATNVNSPTVDNVPSNGTNTPTNGVVTAAAVQTLISTPETLHQLGGTTRPALRKPNQVYIPNIRPSGILAPGELKSIVVQMDKKAYYQTAARINPLYSWNLVGSFTVQAHGS